MMARDHITASSSHLGLQNSFDPLRSAELVSLNAQRYHFRRMDAHARETSAKQTR